MIQIFVNGGWSMFPVVLLGLAACAAGVVDAVRGRAEGGSTLKALSVATGLVSVGGTALNLATVGYAVSGNAEWAASSAIILQGVAESLGPVIFGAALLGIAWVAKAVATRRATAATAAA